MYKLKYNKTVCLELFCIFIYVYIKKIVAPWRQEEGVYQLQEFVVMDNNRNWRFRYELAE